MKKYLKAPISLIIVFSLVILGGLGQIAYDSYSVKERTNCGVIGMSNVKAVEAPTIYIATKSWLSINPVYAQSVDLLCDGTADYVQWQSAADSLANGGKLVDLCGTSYNFGNDTVTMTHDNITIEGAGGSTYFYNDGATLLFSDGGYDNILFKDFRTDGGNVTRDNSNDSYCQNVWIGTEYTFEGPEGTGGGGSSLTQEEVEDYAGNMVSGGTETRIAATYDDAAGMFNFVVDDMNDDVPESGDFGAAGDLDADGTITDGVIDEADLDINNAAVDEYVLSYESDDGKFQWKDASAAGDSISIDGVGVVDPDFVSTGDIDFTDTVNIITGDLNADSVGTAEIVNDSIDEVDVHIDNSPTDEYVLTYESDTGNFAWQEGAGDNMGSVNTEAELESTLGDTSDVYTDNDGTLWTQEQIEDFVGNMTTGNTETRITVTYEDGDGTLDFVVDDLDTDTNLSQEEVEDYIGGLISDGDSVQTRVTVTYQDATDSLDFVVDDLDTDTNLTQEEVDDYVAALISDADSVHTRITITYDDADDAYDFVVDTVTLGEIQTACTNDFHNIGGTDDDVPDSGDLAIIDTEGEFESELFAIFTPNDGALDDDDVTAADVGLASPNLDDSDASIEWEDATDLDADGSVSANAVTLGTDTTGNYVETLAEGTYIDLSGADAEGSTKTVSVDITEIGNATWYSGVASYIDWTWNLTGTNPVLRLSNGVFNLQTGELQEGGYPVFTTEDGALDDDDVTDDTFTTLSDVSVTHNLGDMLYGNGTAWIDLAAPTFDGVLFNTGSSAPEWIEIDSDNYIEVSSGNLTHTPVLRFMPEIFVCSMSGNSSTSVGDCEAVDFNGMELHVVEFTTGDEAYFHMKLPADFGYGGNTTITVSHGIRVQDGSSGSALVMATKIGTSISDYLSEDWHNSANLAWAQIDELHWTADLVIDESLSAGTQDLYFGIKLVSEDWDSTDIYLDKVLFQAWGV